MRIAHFLDGLAATSLIDAPFAENFLSRRQIPCPMRRQNSSLRCNSSAGLEGIADLSQISPIRRE